MSSNTSRSLGFLASCNELDKLTDYADTTLLRETDQSKICNQEANAKRG